MSAAFQVNDSTKSANTATEPRRALAPGRHWLGGVKCARWRAEVIPGISGKNQLVAVLIWNCHTVKGKTLFLLEVHLEERYKKKARAKQAEEGQEIAVSRKVQTLSFLLKEQLFLPQRCIEGVTFGLVAGAFSYERPTWIVSASAGEVLATECGASIYILKQIPQKPEPLLQPKGALDVYFSHVGSVPLHFKLPEWTALQASQLFQCGKRKSHLSCCCRRIYLPCVTFS